MSSVRFLQGIGKGITKITEMSYPKGTLVKNVEHFGGDYMRREVIRSKHVYLSSNNPLCNAGLKQIQRHVLKDGTAILEACNGNGQIIARGIKEVKELIKAMKNFGLTL